MASKSELEAELESLKRELAASRAEEKEPKTARERKSRSTLAGLDLSGRKTPDGEPDTEAASTNGEDGEKPESTLDWALAQLDGTEIDKLFKEFVAELEDMHEQKPLMTLFGAFVLGYVLGRAR